MPAAMVLPMAAAMPNHMPKTWRRRPRPAAGVELTVEEASDDSDNVRSRGMRETQPSYRGEEKMQARSGEFERAQRGVPTGFHGPQARNSWTGTKWARAIFLMSSGCVSH